MRTSRRLRNDEGSGFMLALFVTLILSILALTLMHVTETEKQLGDTERVLATGFYAAESGLHVNIANVLVTSDVDAAAFVVPEGEVGTQQLGTRVFTTQIFPVDRQNPPMTVANAGEATYFSYSYIMRSVAERVSWPASITSPIIACDDPNSDLVIRQSRTDLEIRYLVSPVSAPDYAGNALEADGVFEIKGFNCSGGGATGIPGIGDNG